MDGYRWFVYKLKMPSFCYVMPYALLNVNFIIQAVNVMSHLAFHPRVTQNIYRLFIFHTQGNNCEHNYDDCLLNPCPEAYSCLDGINKVTCLAPVTDTVPLATVVKNITHGSTPRVPTPTLSLAPTAEQSTGINHTVPACSVGPSLLRYPYAFF